VGGISGGGDSNGTIVVDEVCYCQGRKIVALRTTPPCGKKTKLELGRKGGKKRGVTKKERVRSNRQKAAGGGGLKVNRHSQTQKGEGEKTFSAGLARDERSIRDRWMEATKGKHASNVDSKERAGEDPALLWVEEGKQTRPRGGRGVLRKTALVDRMR